jgi:hypothetical protein
MDSEEDPPASEGIIRNVSVRIFKMVSLISPQNKSFLIVEYQYNMLSKKFEKSISAQTWSSVNFRGLKKFIHLVRLSL